MIDLRTAIPIKLGASRPDPILDAESVPIQASDGSAEA